MFIRKKFLHFLAIISVFIICGIGSSSYAKTLMLVPGYFNSYVPGNLKGWAQPYWSPDIVKIFKKAGFQVFVVNNLNPVGSIEENGENLSVFFSNIKTQLKKDELIYVISHSAGGLYTLYANNKENLPIKKLITINTPFEGLDFVDRLTNDFPEIKSLEKKLNMESLNQLRPDLVHEFIIRLKKPQFPIVAYFGYQKKDIEIWNAAYLSPIFYVTGALMDGISDGIVTQKSALSQKGFIQVIEGDEYIKLDHWKQTLKAEYFTLLGMTNLDYIRKEQHRFYTKLLNHFEN